VNRYCTTLLLLLLSLGLIGTALGQSANQAPAGAASGQQPTSAIAEGAQVWATNCMRCHSVPEKLSPREVRAVLRQMRVRANLSARDEQLLLKFLAPAP
jgi:mono/diheme cytochrome c family protein